MGLSGIGGKKGSDKKPTKPDEMDKLLKKYNGTPASADDTTLATAQALEALQPPAASGGNPIVADTEAPGSMYASDDLRKSTVPVAAQTIEQQVEGAIRAKLAESSIITPEIKVHLAAGRVGGEGTYELQIQPHDYPSADMIAAGIPLEMFSSEINKARRIKLDTWFVPESLAKERFSALTDAAAAGEDLNQAARKLTYKQGNKDVPYAHYARQLSDGNYEIKVRFDKERDIRPLIVGINKAEKIKCEKLQGAILYAPEKATNQSLEISQPSKTL